MYRLSFRDVSKQPGRIFVCCYYIELQHCDSYYLHDYCAAYDLHDYRAAYDLHDYCAAYDLYDYCAAYNFYYYSPTNDLDNHSSTNDLDNHSTAHDLHDHHAAHDIHVHASDNHARALPSRLLHDHPWQLLRVRRGDLSGSVWPVYLSKLQCWDVSESDESNCLCSLSIRIISESNKSVLLLAVRRWHLPECL